MTTPASADSTAPDASADLIAALLRTRSALLLDLAPDGDAESLLILTNLPGTFQLAELRDGELRELTALPEPVSAAAYVPTGADTRPRQAILAADAGGNERSQLYRLDLERETPATTFADLEALTAAPEYGHHLAGLSPDGRLLAFTSNRANGVDFDLWLRDLDSGEERLLYAGRSWCHAAGGFSPDGRWIAVSRAGRRALDDDLVLVEVATGDTRWPLPHPEAAAQVGTPAWIDADRFLVTANTDSDHLRLHVHDLSTGTTAAVTGAPESVDIEAVVNHGEHLVIVAENRHGATPLRRLGPDGGEIPVPEAGVVADYAMAGPRLSADGRRLYFTLTTPRRAAEVYRHDLETGETAQLTHSPHEVEPDRLAPAEVVSITSFDGEPVELYRFGPVTPAVAGERPPVVVHVHGGPESQAQLTFNPIIQALVASGYGVLVPNVRGSTGYGKRFAGLDDTVRRLDSVADLAAIHDALPDLGFDPDRAALWGGSYGGYMVLAGVSMQPERWAAGVDIVGISNLVTFLEHTSDYRRPYREVEYGSLEHDREFLIQASPMTYAEQIRAPLFIIHGENDPRVPVGEARQLHADLERRGVPSELVIYDNEGHGLGRLENRLDAYPRAIAFLDRHLRSSG